MAIAEIYVCGLLENRSRAGFSACVHTKNASADPSSAAAGEKASRVALFRLPLNDKSVVAGTFQAVTDAKSFCAETWSVIAGAFHIEGNVDLAIRWRFSGLVHR